MSTISLNFPDSTYSTSNKPSADTLKADLQAVETGHNAHESATSVHGLSGNVVGTSDAQTLTNKTLTSPVLNTGVSGTAVLDEDDMSSDSATKLATQQSIKAYVDRALFSTLNIAPIYAPQGFLINGKIVPSVTSNNFTAAIKGLDGNDPSATNPVYCRIGDSVRSITSALSVTAAAATNWFNAGGSELATKEIDYFAYLGYNPTDGVVLGFSRYPGARQYSDFSATSTNEKYCRISTITTAASTDYYEVVGRFAATLSAGAGYTWTVPTYTAVNLIQQPIYETRWLDWVPTITSGSGTPTTVTKTENTYKIVRNTCHVVSDCTIADKGTAASTFIVSLPFSTATTYGSFAGRESGVTGNLFGGNFATTVMNALQHGGTTLWTNSYRVPIKTNYEI